MLYWKPRQYSIFVAQKIYHCPSTWRTRLDTPCPLLLPCSDCKELVPAVDFYDAKRGRKTITGRSVLSVCKRCSVERYKRLDPRTKLYYAAKRRAASAGIEFSITPNDISIPAVCPVLKKPITDGTNAGPKHGSTNDYSPSLDRIDNTRGYVPENVAVISLRANRIKNDSTIDNLINLLAYASAHGSLLTKEQSQLLMDLLGPV